MNEEFIIKDERKYLLDRKKRLEFFIKKWIKRGYKVAMRKDIAVDILPHNNRLTKREVVN